MIKIEKLEFFNKDKKSIGYLEVENINSNAVHLNIYGDIVGADVYKESDLDIAPSDVLDLLKNIKNKDLTININSPGGSVFSGIGIYNAIKQSCKGNIIVNITGIAGSISSVIAMCGNTINMPMNTHMMIHKPSLSISGDADDLVKASALLNKVQDIILNTYMLNAAIAISRTYIKDLMDKETYLSADDCSKLFKNVVVLQKGFTNKCKDTNDDAEDISEDENNEENKCNEKDKCDSDKTKDSDDKKKSEEDKCKSVDNFMKGLSIFLCKNL
ncbi:MAG: head maturation protease, ClpP-related [Sarcina sp.]